MQSVLRSILARAAMWPDRPAIFQHDNAVTYALLATAICSAEVEIARLGLDREAPVGVLIQSPLDHLVVCLALAKGGYSSASLRSDTIGRCGQYGIATVICDKPLVQAGVRAVVINAKWYQNACDASIARVCAPAADRVVRIEFTSGSTGEPKPIGFTDGAIYRQTVNRIASYDLRGQVSLCMFRMTVNVGFGYALSALMQGRTLCFAENYAQAVDIMNYYRVEDVSGSPRQILALADDFVRHGHAIRVPGKIVLAGGQLAREDYARIKLHLSGEVHLDYGATETGPTAFTTGRLLDGGSAGLSLMAPFQTVAIDAPAGEPGLIRTCATGMGAPFSGSLTQTLADHGDGWFHTGDLGVLNDKGLIELVGRGDDLLNIGGLKVSLDQIEQSVGSLTDVLETAAVVRADAAGAGLRVAVVAREGADSEAISRAVRDILRGASGLEILFVEAIAKTDSGKVDRQSLLRQG